MKKILFALVILNLVAMPLAFAADPSPTTAPTSTGNVMNSDFTFDLRPITQPGIDTTSFMSGGINVIFNRVVALMAGTIATASVLAIVYGGFQIITSMGKEDEMSAGKAMIGKAIKALVFVLGAYVIVTAVQLLVKSLYG